MRLFTKAHLLAHISRYAPRPSIARAVDHAATITLLGGFTKIPPSKWGGWIAKIESPWGSMVWDVAILNGPPKIDGTVFVLDEIPWEFWRGDTATNIVAVGECPDMCKHLKEEAKKGKENDTIKK